MPKISDSLKEIRDKLILKLYKDQTSAEDIGKIFSLTTSQVYNIIKEIKK